MKNQTIKQTLLLITACLGLFVSSNALANNAVLVEHNENTWVVPLPEGYCNATETFLGVVLLDFLDSQFANIDKSIPMPIPKVTFTRCGFESDFDNFYPWGWVGFEDINLSHKDQNTYNKQLEKLIGSSRFAKVFAELAKETTEKTLGEEYGIDVLVLSTELDGVLWKDENVIVWQQTSSYAVEGETVVELLVGASTLMKNLGIYYYVIDIKGGVTTPIENAEKLISNAHKLINLN